MESKIENPWCVYGMERYLGIGKIIKEDNKVLYIQYSEKQMFDSRLWHNQHLKRFSNVKEAADYFIENSDVEKCGVYRHLKEDFPSEKGIEELVLN